MAVLGWVHELDDADLVVELGSPLEDGLGLVVEGRPQQVDAVELAESGDVPVSLVTLPRVVDEHHILVLWRALYHRRVDKRRDVRVGKMDDRVLGEQEVRLGHRGVVQHVALPEGHLVQPNVRYAPLLDVVPVGLNHALEQVDARVVDLRPRHEALPPRRPVARAHLHHGLHLLVVVQPLEEKLHERLAHLRPGARPRKRRVVPLAA
mmetsp:Transcript_37663/g.98246  ORF Transcript_37663/g.98246 Transcript_37663/m.98246 type:complete len:207 (-) Transcript_37663:203-823(-)